MSIFEKASKKKLRFKTTKGFLTTEDLWDLSLQSLDSIAKSVNKQLKVEEEESFISEKSKTNVDLNLKLDILKHVIDVKMKQKDRAAKRAETKAQLQNLKELSASKANEELAGKSKAEIDKMIADLEGQSEE